MASHLKNVAIIGASGSIGSIILQGFLGKSASQFSITVLSRKDSNATFPNGVTVRKTDFSNADLEAALKGQDVVISAVGATALGDQKKLVNAAVRAGVKRFLPSEFSASSQDEAVLQLLPLFGQKKELIEYLKTKESKDFSWTGVASSGLFDWGIANGFLGFDIPNHTATIWDGGNKRFTMTNEKQLALAVISVLKHPEETRNQYIHIASLETTQKEVLAALESATRSKWTVTDTTTESQVSEGRAKLGSGDFTGAYNLVRATSFGNTAGLRSNYVLDEKLANDVLGLNMEDLQDTINTVVSQ